MNILKALGMLFAAFVYLLWPIDIIPDLLIGPGQIDDLAVIVACVQKAIAFAKEGTPTA